MAERFKVFGCAICLIIRDGKVLMILRKNKPDAGNYNLVGGRMEEGETVAAAIKREIKEEVGLDIEEKDVEVVSTIHRMCEGNWNSIEFITVVKSFRRAPQNLEPEFCERLDWLSLDKLPENITGYALQGINNYKNSVVFSELDI